MPRPLTWSVSISVSICRGGFHTETKVRLSTAQFEPYRCILFIPREGKTRHARATWRSVANALTFFFLLLPCFWTEWALRLASAFFASPRRASELTATRAQSSLRWSDRCRAPNGRWVRPTSRASSSPALPTPASSIGLAGTQTGWRGWNRCWSTRPPHSASPSSLYVARCSYTTVLKIYLRG